MADVTIDLNALVEETSEELLTERKKEVRLKIHFVFQQVATFNREIARLENELAKKREGLAKAEHKLAELRKGNWDILKQIDPQGEKKPES